MYPDYDNAKIGGLPAPEVIGNPAWFTDTFIPTVQQRGAAIIKARGLSSAASAANAIVDTVRGLTMPTAPGAWFSVAACSDGAYGIEKGLIYSYPSRTEGNRLHVVQGLALTEFARSKVIATENELKEEKALVSELLPK
jgi:malate dehydrogenase